jgi:hypothetical protein
MRKLPYIYFGTTQNLNFFLNGSFNDARHERKQTPMPTRAQWWVEVALGLKLDTRNMKMGLDL